MDQMIGIGKNVLGGKVRLRLVLRDSAKQADEDDILAGLGR